ncbi:ATP-binding protein [Gemmatimonas sp.]|uniref:ATP-binding protein n=1 Tax=Gemmatimonas sp. TaxID=1962908 RepID=UPI00286E9BB5|nr:ATP-binding protein [Gemmatimonas sp.]
MQAMAGDWRLLALAAFLNMFSSWSGAVWNDRTLSRVITTSLVAAEIRDSIFEQLFTTKSVGQGIGLGPATVNGTAKQVAGDVVLESTVGRGTTFEVYLPAA